MSDDGRNALTIIGFIGSVFSPYYAHRRRREPTDPAQHCAFNVALYGQGTKRWSMTERSDSSLERDAATLRIGPSSMQWAKDRLEVDINEWCSPLPRRVAGKLNVTLGAVNSTAFLLSATGQHVWRPIAPVARIEVDLVAPRVKWSGSAYFDCNFGEAPIEQAFSRWDWSRTTLPDGSTSVFYDLVRRNEQPLSLGLGFSRDGELTPLSLPDAHPLSGSAWGLQRVARTSTARPRVLQSLEDGPFYSRALIGAGAEGSQACSVHETLCLNRFSKRWVQAMLPFRMPRRAW